MPRLLKRGLRNSFRFCVKRTLAPHFSLGNARRLDRCAYFYGDTPKNHRTFAVGPTPEHTDLSAHGNSAFPAKNFVCVQSYDQDRPAKATYEKVVYSPHGYALHNGRIDYSLSARKKDYNRDFPKLLLRQSDTHLGSATLIESHFPNTYGDWVFEQMRSLTKHLPLQAPLLLPRDIAARGYVKRELDQMGINFLVAATNVKIDRAHVLHKPQHLNFWDNGDVSAYRNALKIEDVPTRSGSVVYLSREGVTGAHAYVTRTYKSAEVSEIVSELGGRTVLTEGMGMDDFRELASEAETVIADHGAAIFNILQWRPKRVIEIVTNNWWDSSPLFVSRAMGVQLHGLVVCDDLDLAGLRHRLTCLLEHEIDGEC